VAQSAVPATVHLHLPKAATNQARQVLLQAAYPLPENRNFKKLSSSGELFLAVQSKRLWIIIPLALKPKQKLKGDWNMNSTEVTAKPPVSPLWGTLWCIIFVVVVGVLFNWVDVYALTMNWGGVNLRNPVRAGRYFENHGRLLVETDYPGQVMSMMPATVIKVAERIVQTQHGQRVITYTGFIPEVVEGQALKQGQVIGRLLFAPDHLHAELRVDHAFEGKVVEPDPNFPPRYKNLGEEVAVTMCIGCHHTLGVYPLDHGKLSGTDQLATKQDIIRVIHDGITPKELWPGMPAFGGTLMDTWIEAAADFTYKSRVAPYIKSQ
jgi:hypothetical protein